MSITLEFDENDNPDINHSLITEELGFELGFQVYCTVVRDGSEISLYVTKADKTSWLPSDATIAQDVIVSHNHALESLEQQLDAEKVLRRDVAKAALVELGSSGIRVAGLPDLSVIVAQIVEALDLDLIGS